MNPNIAAFGQMVRGAPPAMPMAPPNAGPGAPPIAPQALAPMMGRQPQFPQGAPPRPQGAPQAAPQRKYTPQELAALGRYGDSLVAHLTPGEIAVPPQVQTPKVRATLANAFHKAGVSPGQFTAGSPNSSTNPATGVPEYNFWAAAAPILGAVAGGALGSVVPGIGTAYGAMAGGALGGGIAGYENGGFGQGLMGAALGGAGGYFGGDALASAFPETLGGAAADAAAPGVTGGMSVTAPTGMDSTAAAGMAAQSGADPYAAGLAQQQAAQTTAQMAAQQGGTTASTSSLLNFIKAHPLLTGATALGAGSFLTGGFNGNAGTPAPNPAYPSGFTTPMPPVNSLGSAQKQLGQYSYAGPQPNFTNYDPYRVGMGGGWTFFPTNGA